MVMRISFILPYFNEADYIAQTIASLGRQSFRDFQIILVDNGSSDGSAEIARNSCAELGDISVRFLSEPRPGKIHALRSGLAIANTALVGTLDADTIYPPAYVEKCLSLFDSNPRASCAIAMALEGLPVDGAAHRKLRIFAGLFPKKAHSGGCGQTFRRDALEDAGGFDVLRWPCVLEDHEIIHRVSRYGPLLYDGDHICFPSDRRKDRKDCSWTLFERIAYKLLPTAAMDWFFYRFLKRRFAMRGLGNITLRDRDWIDAASPKD